MFIVDAHLDLSHNARSGRDVLLPAVQQRPDEDGIPTVGLPDLRAGSVGLICATVFCLPSLDGKPGYQTHEEAAAEARSQLAWYQRHTAAGRFRWCRRRADVPTGLESGPQPAVLLLEGSDALSTEADVGEWFAAGLRMVGLAWRRTRHAGGTGNPGPLTDDGRALVPLLDRFDIIHDTSHLAEESFWDLLDITAGPVCASHSNCRSIVPTDRQLSDEMIRAITSRGGVIGINFFDKFLLSPDEFGNRRATLADVVRHAKHLSDVSGSARYVGIGTDLDGGFGRENIPVEIETAADLPRVADALNSAGFSDADVAGIVGENWRQFFARSLPA